MQSAAIEITTERSRINVDLVHAFLSSSYWAQGRSRAVLERSIQNSLCFSAFHRGQQVGFGRIVTDYAVFAYIADVFVVPESRGVGIGKALMRAIVEHPELRALPVMLLRTRDAHGLYANVGFQSLPRPEEMMGRYQPPNV
jgi:GNAT superfamily N-acetyltransferase